MNAQCLRKFTSAAIAAAAAVLALPCLAASSLPAGHFIKGKTDLYFDGSGKFSVSEGKESGSVMVEGGYVTTDHQITFTDKSGKEACGKAGEESGSYHWSYAHDVLSFAKIEDRCDARAHDLTAGAWQARK